MAANAVILLLAAAPIARSWKGTFLSPADIAWAKALWAILAGLLWMAGRSLSRDDDRLLPRSFFILSGAWMALLSLTILHADNAALSFRYLAYSAAGYFTFLVAFHLSRKQKRMASAILLGMGGMLGALVLLQYAIVVHHVFTFLEPYIVEPRTQAYFSSNLIPGVADRYRPSGTMSHPNAMGLYFALLLPYAAATTTIRGLGKWTRLVLILSMIVMLLGLWATDSRAAAVCLLSSLIYLGWHSGYRWIAATGTAFLTVILVILALPTIGQPLRETLLSRSRIEYGMSGRPAIWANTASLIREAPFLGTGPGNFQHAYVSHFGFFAPNDMSELMGQIWATQMLGEQVIDNFHAHNIYLQLAGEMGVGGPLLFLAGLLAVVFHCEKTGRQLPLHSQGRSAALATAAVSVGLLIYGLFDSQLAFTLGSLNLVAAPLLAFGVSSPWLS